jgi:hypothetical protein
MPTAVPVMRAARAPGAVCGDGVVGGLEDCDLGPQNADGVYGGCTTSCRYGPYCGDSVVNGPAEDCDLGPQNGDIALGKDGCTLSCRIPSFCGDGKVDPGEECDLGERNGLPGSACPSNCQLLLP